MKEYTPCCDGFIGSSCKGIEQLALVGSYTICCSSPLPMAVPLESVQNTVICKDEIIVVVEDPIRVIVAFGCNRRILTVAHCCLVYAERRGESTGFILQEMCGVDTWSIIKRRRLLLFHTGKKGLSGGDLRVAFGWGTNSPFPCFSALIFYG